MIFRLVMLLLGWLAFLLPVSAEAPVHLTVQFPYSLNGSKEIPASVGSTQLLFISLDHFNHPEERASVTVSLPEGLSARSGKRWQVEDGNIHMELTLPADYGNVFEVIPVALSPSLSEGEGALSVRVTGEDWGLSQKVDFTIKDIPAEEKEASGRQESWYIQSVVLPVNEQGETDARLSPNTMVLPDVTLENIRHRLTGAPIDWAAVLDKPDTYLLLEMRNPGRDVRTVHFKAELVDRGSGEVKEGLMSSSPEEGDVDLDHSSSTEADFSLNGGKMQTAVIPLYANPFAMTEGDYNLRITLSDGENEKLTEIPLTVVKNRSAGLLSTAISSCCLLLILLSLGRIRRTMIRIGARGDIAAALFAALAFGGVVVPVTLLGDFLHVILGPFSGLVTGLLSGVVQYMLLMSLLILFRRPGVTALFYLIRWLLSAILFGRVTPAGILLTASSIAVIEGALLLTGFYRKEKLTLAYGLFISLVMGICDAGLTFINMQQLMLFYRLYYADWFIGLYMVINGLLYSSLGSFLGWKTGSRLRQVMGS